MKILVTGANGMLAKDVKKVMQKDNELVCTDSKELDITDKTKVIEFVKNVKPDYIINCAAYTAVDKAEKEEKLAEKVNSLGTENLAIASKLSTSVLIHISTDYVFGGELDLEKDYLEEDKKQPNTVYGITKLKGENKIQENCSRFYIFRTAWLYGTGGNNFVKTIIKKGKTKDKINVVCDQHGSPTYTLDLANVIKQAINKKIPYGIYHATNEGYTTWYKFTKKIFEKQKINCKAIPVTTKEYIKSIAIVQAKRPTNSKLSKNKLKSQGINVPTWEDALNRYLAEENNVN